MIDRFTSHLLGRHVADRSDDDAVHASGRHASDDVDARYRRLAHHARQTEVEDLDAVVVRDQQVLGLQIAMDDAFLVRGSESLRDL